MRSRHALSAWIQLNRMETGFIMRINFDFEGKRYQVGMDAHDNNLPIKLPDGRVIKVTSWLERRPPAPEGFEILECAEATLCAEDAQG